MPSPTGQPCPNYLNSAITTPSTNYACDTNKMEAGSLWLGLSGLAIIAVLMQRNVKVADGCLLPGKLACHRASWQPLWRALLEGSYILCCGMLGCLRPEATMYHLIVSTTLMQLQRDIPRDPHPTRACRVPSWWALCG